MSDFHLGCAAAAVILALLALMFGLPDFNLISDDKDENDPWKGDR